MDLTVPQFVELYMPVGLFLQIPFININIQNSAYQIQRSGQNPLK